MFDSIGAWDYALFQSIHAWCSPGSFGADLIGAFSKYGVIFIALYFIYMWFVGPKGKVRDSQRRYALFLALAIVVSLIVDGIIAHFFFRERPFIAHPGIIPFIDHKPTGSFPSNHSAAAFAWFFAALAAGRKECIAIFVFAVCMALSRIIVGVHYPLDVVGGFVVAAVVTYVLLRTQRYWRRITDKFVHLWGKLGI